MNCWEIFFDVFHISLTLKMVIMGEKEEIEDAKLDASINSARRTRVQPEEKTFLM